MMPNSVSIKGSYLQLKEKKEVVYFIVTGRHDENPLLDILL